MKAYLIDGEKQTIENTDITSMEDITRLIGYQTLESDEVGKDGDRLYFDEECFLRGTTGRFQIDTLIPVSGKGVVIGSGEEGTLSETKISLEDLSARLKYL